MDQASPDTFQNLSVRITAREKVREAHALADLPLSPRFRSRKLSYPAVPPSPAIAHLYVNDVR